jgi:hypothetical protein
VVRVLNNNLPSVLRVNDMCLHKIAFSINFFAFTRLVVRHIVFTPIVDITTTASQSDLRSFIFSAEMTVQQPLKSAEQPTNKKVPHTSRTHASIQQLIQQAHPTTNSKQSTIISIHSIQSSNHPSTHPHQSIINQRLLVASCELVKLVRFHWAYSTRARISRSRKLITHRLVR